MKVKKHWKNNQNLIRDFTALKRQPVVVKVKSKIEILKDRIQELRNRYNELVDRGI